MQLFDKEFIGALIKKHRKKHKLTQAELAEKADMSEKHIGQIERGVFQPTLISFFKIANVLNINLNEIFSYKNEITNYELEKLHKIIYTASDTELKMYLNIIETIKNNIKDLKNEK